MPPNVSINDPKYKESGIDKASELITAIGGLMNGSVPKLHDGGKVKKTGLALVQKGETVVSKEGKVSDKPHNVSLYRAIHHMNKGGLHRALGVKEGDKIPADKLAKARNSTNEHVKKMAQFAHTLGTFHK